MYNVLFISNFYDCFYTYPFYCGSWGFIYLYIHVFFYFILTLNPPQPSPYVFMRDDKNALVNGQTIQ